MYTSDIRHASLQSHTAHRDRVACIRQIYVMPVYKDTQHIVIV